MSLLDDWMIYRNGEKAFDRFRFGNLLKSHSTTSELLQIFNGMPGSEETIDRTLDLINRSQLNGLGYRVPLAQNTIVPAAAQSLIEAITAEQDRHLIRLGLEDLLLELSELSIKFTTIEHIKAEMDDQNNLSFAIFDEIGDDYIGQPFEPRDVFIGLYEATLALTNSATVTRYLLDPIWPYAQKFENDFHLFLGGYTSFATNREILFAKFI